MPAPALLKNLARGLFDVLRGLAIVTGIAVLLLVGLPVLAIYVYIHWHGESADTRRAIAAEARAAMRYAPAQARDAMPRTLDLASLSAGMPKDRAPGTLAALAPESVTASPDGIYIEMRRVFIVDAGYFVPRDGRAPKDRGDFRYTALGDGVWWYVDED